MSSVSALGSSVLMPRRLSADPMGILRTMKDIGRPTCSIVCHLRISPPLAPYAKSNSSACRSLNSFGVGVCFQGVCCEPPSCNRSLKGNIERVCGALPLLLASSAGSIREEVKVAGSTRESSSEALLFFFFSFPPPPALLLLLLLSPFFCSSAKEEVVVVVVAVFSPSEVVVVPRWGGRSALQK